jgi:signal transduction histidine kinase
MLARLSAQFGIPLTLRAAPALELTTEQLRQLAEHRVVGFNMQGRGDEVYYKRLDDDSALLQIGPLPIPFVLRLATPIVYAAFATVLGIIAFLWIRPLWADIRRLDQRAAEFGCGDLSARVEVGAGSSIRPLAATFNSMASQIQSFIATQRELNDAVSHELRTPLARLRFGLDMMSASASSEDRQRYARGMAADISELEALVDESLSYARLTAASGVQLHTETIEIRSWIEEIVAASAIRPGGLSPEVEVSSTRGSFVFDRRLLARAVQNLVRNAVQFASTRVRIVIADAGNGLQIEVHDDGPGVPVDERTAIFLPYHRVDDSRSRESGGYGLGLAIVKRVCDLHQATVAVGDSPLGGACFSIRIPG